MGVLRTIVSWPKRAVYRVGSGLAVFLVQRRLKKRPQEAGTWILLARLREVREEPGMAVKTLQQGLQALPRNKAIQMHLERLRAQSRRGKQ